MTTTKLGRKNIESDARTLRVMGAYATSPTGTVDHGGLLGLSDDDHVQYVHLSSARTITAQHTFSPASGQPPFVLGVNAQSQLVTGLRADELSKTVTAGAGLTGGGSLTGNITLDIGAGNGITVNANDVALTTPGTLSVSSSNAASGNHTHAITSSSNPGAAASLLASSAAGYLQLTRLGAGVSPSVPLHALATTEQLRLAYDVSNYASFTVGSGGNLTLAPTGDLIFNPTGNDILPTTGYDLNLGSFTKKYLTLHAAELWVETLVAQNTIATIGGRILVGPTTTLIADLAAADTTMDIKHNQIRSGDRVYLEANGSVEFLAVTSTATTITGGYRYSITRDLDGSGANDWSAGDAVFNTGQAGNGFIDLYSVSGVDASSTAGPTIVGNVRNSSTYNDWTEHWAIGNLNGLYGYGTDTYGVALGEYGTGNQSFVTMDSTNGIRFYWGSTIVGQWQVGGDVIFGEVATDKANLFWDQSAGRLNFRGGTSGTAVEAYIDSDGTITAGGGTVLLNSDGVSIESDTQSPASVWNFTPATTDALRFVNGSGDVYGWLFANFASSSKRQLFLRNEPGAAGDNGEIYIQARSDNANATLTLGASYSGTSVGPYISLLGGSTPATSLMTFGNVLYYDFVEGDITVDDGSIFIGDTANGNMTVGLTINQGAADNEIVALKSSDVAHGITGETETDNFGLMKKASATAGGLRIYGFSEDVIALQLYGAGTNDDTTRSTAALGYVDILARKKSGTSVTGAGADANLLTVRNNGNTRFLVDAEGDIHMDATSNINAWDAHDDIALLAGVREAMNPALRLAEFVEEARPVLERTGVVTYNPDGHHFISLKKLHALEIDAMRQLYQENRRLAEKLDRLEKLFNTNFTN